MFHTTLVLSWNDIALRLLNVLLVTLSMLTVNQPTLALFKMFLSPAVVKDELSNVKYIQLTATHVHEHTHLPSHTHILHFASVFKECVC